MDLQKEIKQLRQSKYELISATNTQINSMRDTIKLLMHRISSKINPAPFTDHEHKSNANYNDALLHNYSKLGGDDVVNIVLLGTKCSGKTTLLRNIIISLSDTKSFFKSIKNVRHMIINSIVSSIYSVLFENDFFQSEKYRSRLNLSPTMKDSISYFEKNRLSQYDAPYLTDDVVNTIRRIFDNSGNSNDDHFVRLVFMSHCFYKNYMYFYQNIEKFTKSRWYQHFSSDELLLIWDRTTLPIYFYDIQLDESHSTIYRIWDISSEVLYDANKRFRNNLQAFMESICASCVIYITSPVFAYQIEKQSDCLMDETSMRKSIKYFRAMFEEQEEFKDDGGGGDILRLMRSKWEFVPIITLFNKCDVFKMDMESSWDETKTILLSFAEYDGEQSYDAVMDYLKIIFESFKVSKKRPFHIYETTVIDGERVKSIVHHIKTVTNLYTNNKRLTNQINVKSPFVNCLD